MEKTPTANEKRSKTSINLKQSLRNAAIKHLIDLTGQTEVSQAVELALTEWLTSGHEYSSDGSSKSKNTLQIVSGPTKMGEPSRSTEVTAEEFNLIDQLLRIARGTNKGMADAVQNTIQSLSATLAAPQVPSRGDAHTPRGSKDPGKAGKRLGGDKKPSG